MSTSPALRSPPASYFAHFESLSLPEGSLEEERTTHDLTDTSVKTDHLTDTSVKTEITKISGKILMNSGFLATHFMDGKKWEALFPAVVRSSLFREPFETREEPYEVRDVEIPALVNVVTAKVSLRSLSPVIPPKEYEIVRLLKNVSYGALIVDVVVEKARDGSTKESVSGCRVEPLSDTESKVTFVVQNSYTIEGLPEGYEYLMKKAFSSVRWFATLKRECERRAILGSFSSPVVLPDDNVNDEYYEMMARTARIMRVKFSTILTVDRERYQVDRINFFNPNPSLGIFSALSSIRVNAPHDKTFKLCKDLVMAEYGQGGVETQIPPQFPSQSVDNCVFSILSGNKDRTLVETYLDASEAMVVYALQKEYDQVLLNPSGFCIQPDGEGGSYLTIAVLAELVEGADQSVWEQGVEARINGFATRIMDAARAGAVAV